MMGALESVNDYLVIGIGFALLFLVLCGYTLASVTGRIGRLSLAELGGLGFAVGALIGLGGSMATSVNARLTVEFTIGMAIGLAAGLPGALLVNRAFSRVRLWDGR
jgi:hypothetical protein